MSCCSATSRSNPSTKPWVRPSTQRATTLTRTFVNSIAITPHEGDWLHFHPRLGNDRARNALTGSMRCALSLLLMVLLLLRATVGTAMACEVASLPAPSQSAAHSQQERAGHETTTAMAPSVAPGLETASIHGDGAYADTAHTMLPTAGAALMAPPHCAGFTEGGTNPGHHAANCTDCEVCHSPMLAVPSVLSPHRQTTLAPLPLRAVPSDSATTALPIKPPIA